LKDNDAIDFHALTAEYISCHARQTVRFDADAEAVARLTRSRAIFTRSMLPDALTVAKLARQVFEHVCDVHAL